MYCNIPTSSKIAGLKSDLWDLQSECRNRNTVDQTNGASSSYRLFDTTNIKTLGASVLLPPLCMAGNLQMFIAFCHNYLGWNGLLYIQICVMYICGCFMFGKILRSRSKWCYRNSSTFVNVFLKWYTFDGNWNLLCILMRLFFIK